MALARLLAKQKDFDAAEDNLKKAIHNFKFKMSGENKTEEMVPEDHYRVPREIRSLRQRMGDP